MSQQPVWKRIGTVGDVNPFDYDGGFIYQDETGVYTEELEYIQAQDEGYSDIAGPWLVYRIMLDRCKIHTDTRGNVYLIPYVYDETWPHPIESYDEWFNEDLQSVADCMGTTVQELRDALCSEDATQRAWAYMELAMYHGWENFDSYTLTFTHRDELEARYANKG